MGSYVNLNGSNNQNVGYSNFVLGSNNTTLGSKNDIVGSGSISFNTASDLNQIFGNSSIVMGHNEVVVSGISVGYSSNKKRESRIHQDHLQKPPGHLQKLEKTTEILRNPETLLGKHVVSNLTQPHPQHCLRNPWDKKSRDLKT